jgi:NDP-sugar pyrophosphorylase family protein
MRSPEVLAVVMAGGKGERMRSSQAQGPGRFDQAPLPKPLIPVRGVPLLERNVCALLRAGLKDIVVATPRALPEVGTFARSRCAALASVAGARLEVFEEAAPLGTIGCLGVLDRPASLTLVVNADNLTTLDLAALLADHRASEAALTVATHVHTWCLPWAEVLTEGRQVIQYREKPRYPVQVASAVYALSPQALGLLVPGQRRDAPELVQALLAEGALVRSFAHAAPWIDVNDAAAVRAAEALVAAHAETFECWAPEPAVEVAGCVLLREDEVLLEYRPAHARAYPDQWDTPGGRIEPGETPFEAARRELDEELGVHPTAADLRPLCRFDDVDPAAGRIFRHHVFVGHLDGTVIARQGQRIAWHRRDALGELPSLGRVVARSLAALAASSAPSALPTLMKRESSEVGA